MSQQLEAQAWHVAGHAYIATGFGFPVEKLSLEGFSDSDLAETDDLTQRLDEWTMVRVPEMPYPPGTFQHTRVMENLCRVALAGPVTELFIQRHQTTVHNVRQYEHDWRQAWTAAGCLFQDETLRLDHVTREVGRAATYIGLPHSLEYIVPLVRHLIEYRNMSGSQVQDIWDRIQTEHESRSNRPINRRLFKLYNGETHEEWIDLTFDPEEELEAFDSDEELYPE